MLAMLTGSADARAAGDSSPSTAASPSGEYLVKAAFLYNFAKFTQWPESAFLGPAAPLRLCVLGDNPFGDVLSTLSQRTVNGRPLATQQVEDPNALQGCHIVFVSASAQQHSVGTLNLASDGAILSIGEEPGFARSGGVINLIIVKDRVRFEINLASARRIGLKLDVRLLQLADFVYNDISERK